MSEKTSKSKSKAKSKTDSSKPKTKPTSKTKDKTKLKSKPKTTTKKATTRKTKPKTAPKKSAKTKKKTKKKTKTKPTVREKPRKSRPRRLPLEEPVKGVLMNYQRGTVQQRSHYGLIQLEGITTLAAAASYIGRSVILHYSEQSQINGRVISVHGRNGVLRVRFRRGLAAEAIAKEVIVF